MANPCDFDGIQRAVRDLGPLSTNGWAMAKYVKSIPTAMAKKTFKKIRKNC